jgi:hypothetical protein
VAIFENYRGLGIIWSSTIGATLGFQCFILAIKAKKTDLRKPNKPE